MVQQTRTAAMPQQYLRDLADIAAGLPILDEDLEVSRLESDWSRRPARDFRGMNVWQLPNGTFIAIASPALRSQLQRSRHSVRH